ncbi:hypothetical protein F4560_008606 [Saccharothrix ecbatanensis]|uniref:Uncharacterized protein n=1 Tax=Saccharothrix ecbatanensis TaxID=1105145 RepID=A0A7W9HVN3_9PSEU|nr:hypothetical protein [Saccharothrix ecbatanensis]MBB5808838.1 hypothetical protein [Saccharothrix ecbatanensis]
MDHRELRFKLPADLPNHIYATVAHAMFSVLDVAGIADVCSVLIDDGASDADLNEAFDRHSEFYPWGAS